MLTESEIIRRIRNRARPGDKVVVGIGDDAAVINVGGEFDLIVCCDLIVEGVHFRKEWARPRWIGHKALAVTISDVAAMGGTPRFAMVSCAFPSTESAETVDELLRGLFGVAEAHGIAIVGGDTSSSPGALFIDTIVIGQCAKNKAVRRSGARVGDAIFVTGELGSSALGLLLLQQGHRFESYDGVVLQSPEDRARHEAIKKHLAPEPRVRSGQAIAAAGIASAMIDISDGLSTDLWHIIEESCCGAIIRQDLLPVARPVKLLAASGLGCDPFWLALHGGEQYELLFTAPGERAGQISEVSRAVDLPITRIGAIVAEKALLLERDGKSEALSPSGYEHLARETRPMT